MTKPNKEIDLLDVAIFVAGGLLAIHIAETQPILLQKYFPRVRECSHCNEPIIEGEEHYPYCPYCGMERDTND